MTTENPGSLVALRSARDQTITILSDNFARDVIDMDEFERRLTLAHSAQSLAELAVLTQDLEVPQTPARVPPPAAMVTASRVQAQQSMVAIMGGSNRSGRWMVPRRLNTLSVMGGFELDFREALLAPGITEIQIVSVMGGVHIIVPPTLPVEMSGIAIMGGFEHCERAPAQLDDDTPLLRITGFVMMGGVSIETRLPGETERHSRHRRRLEKKEQRKLPGPAKE